MPEVTKSQKRRLAAMGRKPTEPDISTYRGRFAKRLRGLRMRRYDAQDDFVTALAANGLEVTRGTVSHWERGFRAPAIEQYPVIAETLGVSIRSLLPVN